MPRVIPVALRVGLHAGTLVNVGVPKFTMHGEVSEVPTVTVNALFVPVIVGEVPHVPIVGIPCPESDPAPILRAGVKADGDTALSLWVTTFQWEVDGMVPSDIFDPVPTRERVKSLFPPVSFTAVSVWLLSQVAMTCKPELFVEKQVSGVPLLLPASTRML